MLSVILFFFFTFLSTNKNKRYLFVLLMISHYLHCCMMLKIIYLKKRQHSKRKSFICFYLSRATSILTSVFTNTSNYYIKTSEWLKVLNQRSYMLLLHTVSRIILKINSRGHFYSLIFLPYIQIN